MRLVRQRGKWIPAERKNPRLPKTRAHFSWKCWTPITGGPSYGSRTKNGLVFSSTAIRAVGNSSEVAARESFKQLQSPQLPRQEEATATAKQESSHDFSLAPPHASETTASSDSSAAP